MLGPTVVDGAVVYDEIGSAADLPVGWRSESAPGAYRLSDGGGERAFDYGVGADRLEALHASRRSCRSTRATSEGGSVDGRAGRRTGAAGSPSSASAPASSPPSGSRTGRCGPARSATPTTRRAATPPWSSPSSAPAPRSTCFCTSMGTGPEVTRRRRPRPGRARRRVPRPGRQPGRGARSSTRWTCPRRPTPTRPPRPPRSPPSARAIGDPVAAEGLPGRLRARARPPALGRDRRALPRLRQLHARLPDLLLHERERRRPTSTASRRRPSATWDSCFTLGFGRVAGGNFRPRSQDRYRQWLTHKFATWWDQFGSSGCVGCGRCIAWCPVGIDVREELAAIAPAVRADGPASRGRSSPAEGRAPAAAGARRAGDRTRSRRCAPSVAARPSTPSRSPRHRRPGAPRRPPGPVRDGRAAGLRRARRSRSPAIRPDGLELTIRAAGPATARPDRARHRAPRSRCAARSAAAGRSRRPSAATSSSSPAASAWRRSGRSSTRSSRERDAVRRRPPLPGRADAARPALRRRARRARRPASTSRSPRPSTAPGRTGSAGSASSPSSSTRRTLGRRRGRPPSSAARSG